MQNENKTMPKISNQNGFFLIDKPKTWTSFDVCGFLRKKLDTKRVGHTGTLDPFATGLLIVAMGRCTRLIPYLERATKTYHATIIFGKTTPTLDSESEITDCQFTGTPPTQEAITAYINNNFLGDFDQIPPAFSAIKINGQKMYDLARKGHKVDIPPRPVTLHSFKVLSYSFPSISLELTTGAGFYVRSFARDLGTHFTGGGYCQDLRRTHINTVDVSNATAPHDALTPIDPLNILTHLQQHIIPENRLPDFQNGRAFPIDSTKNLPESTPVLLTHNNTTQGIGIVTHDKIQPKIVIKTAE
jgi:tRNA pseudouridine55 synthase